MSTRKIYYQWKSKLTFLVGKTRSRRNVAQITHSFKSVRLSASLPTNWNRTHQSLSDIFRFDLFSTGVRSAKGERLETDCYEYDVNSCRIHLNERVFLVFSHAFRLEWIEHAYLQPKYGWSPKFRVRIVYRSAASQEKKCWALHIHRATCHWRVSNTAGLAILDDQRLMTFHFACICELFS